MFICFIIKYLINKIYFFLFDEFLVQLVVVLAIGHLLNGGKVDIRTLNCK